MEYVLERTFSVLRSNGKLPDENSAVSPLPNATWDTIGSFGRLADAVIIGMDGERSSHHLRVPSDVQYVYFLRVVDAQHCIYRIRYVDGQSL